MQNQKPQEEGGEGSKREEGEGGKRRDGEPWATTGTIETHGSQNTTKHTKNQPKPPQNPPQTTPKPIVGWFWGGFGGVLGGLGGFGGVLGPRGFQYLPEALSSRLEQASQNRRRSPGIRAPICWHYFSGHRKTRKHKGIFSGNGVRRFTGGSRPQGHLPRLISDGFWPVFSTIRDPRNIPLCAIPLCVCLAP